MSRRWRGNPILSFSPANLETWQSIDAAVAQRNIPPKKTAEVDTHRHANLYFSILSRWNRGKSAFEYGCSLIKLTTINKLYIHWYIFTYTSHKYNTYFYSRSRAHYILWEYNYLEYVRWIYNLNNRK